MKLWERKEEFHGGRDKGWVADEVMAGKRNLVLVYQIFCFKGTWFGNGE